MRHRLEMEGALNDCCVIRTTLETLDLFPADNSIRAEMFEIIAEAKISLLRLLFDLCDDVLTRPETLDFNFETFRTNTLNLMQSGYSTQSLNRMMKTDVFCRQENELYYFPLAGTHTLEELKTMPAPQFAALLLCEIVDSANTEANYRDKKTFDRNVFERCMGFLFLQCAARDPLFYKIISKFEK